MVNLFAMLVDIGKKKNMLKINLAKIEDMINLFKENENQPFMVSEYTRITETQKTYYITVSTLADWEETPAIITTGKYIGTLSNVNIPEAEKEITDKIKTEKENIIKTLEENKFIVYEGMITE